MKNTEKIKEMLYRLYSPVCKTMDFEIQYEPIAIVRLIFSGGDGDGDIDILCENGVWFVGDFNNIGRGELWQIEQELEIINN